MLSRLVITFLSKSAYTCGQRKGLGLAMGEPVYVCAKDMQKNIFKRFYKGENSKDPKSIGIGLSLSKTIIEGLGGEIKVDSDEGKGTTFIISFLRK